MGSADKLETLILDRLEFVEKGHIGSVKEDVTIFHPLDVSLGTISSIYNMIGVHQLDSG